MGAVPTRLCHGPSSQGKEGASGWTGLASSLLAGRIRSVDSSCFQRRGPPEAVTLIYRQFPALGCLTKPCSKEDSERSLLNVVLNADLHKPKPDGPEMRAR